MENYLLNNYGLSTKEKFQSLFISEYGLRHLKKAEEDPQHKWGHRVIAIIEFCPVLGIVASLIEKILSEILNKNLILETVNSTQKSNKFSFKIFKGSQINCNGCVDIDEVQNMCLELDRKSARGIRFNHLKLEPNITGGTCSAMSLKFISMYRKFKQKNPNISQKELMKKFQHGNKFTESSKKMRNRQAAFNAIEVDKNVDKVNYSINKIQSILNFKGYKIEFSSELLDLDSKKFDYAFIKELEDFKDGIYFVRLIKPSNNEKLEERGHSMVYIQENSLRFFYDPNFGLQFLGDCDYKQILIHSLQKCNKVFGTNQLNFYRIKM